MHLVRNRNRRNEGNWSQAEIARMKANPHTLVLWIPLIALVLLTVGLAMMFLFVEWWYDYLRWARLIQGNIA